MSRSIVEAIRDYLNTCPLLAGSRFNVDYLTEKADEGYSIEVIPCEPYIKKYIDGSGVKQFQFALMSKEFYEEDARVNIENTGLYEDIENWIQQSNITGNYPVLEENQIPYSIEVTSKGYCFDATGTTAAYRIELRFTYAK